LILSARQSIQYLDRMRREDGTEWFKDKSNQSRNCIKSTQHKKKVIYKLDEYKIILKKFPKAQHWESTVINNRLWTNWECFHTENPSWRLEDRIKRICTSRKELPAVAFPQRISCPAFPAPCKPTGVLTQKEYPDPHSGSSCHLAWSCSPQPNVKSLSFHPTQQLKSFCYLEMHLLKLVGDIQQCNKDSDLDHKESFVEWYSLDHEEED
jgi:hypothetical protein